MFPGLIARKVGMSRVFLPSGEAMPVTYLRIEPNVVVRTKRADRDGYNAVVLGIAPRTWKTATGETRTRYRIQREWRVASLEGLEPGTSITAEIVPKDGTVTIIGVSKGKGFQGVVRRHHFAGGPASHGSHMKREPGSIGMRTWPGRIFRGHRMAGHMGLKSVTVKRRPVLATEPKEGIIGVKGPVPGANGSHVFLTMDSPSP